MDFPTQMSAIAVPYYPVNHSFNSRLPKLNLPVHVFNGDPLEWLSFWDSFDVGLNNKPSATEVDKFNYLKAQVTGEAERAITGFPNRSFYDILETNITALEALGKSQDTSGDLLVPVILAKLSEETNRNLARSQQGDYWTIQNLREALKQDLKVWKQEQLPCWVLHPWY